MIKAYVADAELTGFAAELEQELEPLMVQAVEAGAEVFAKAVRSRLGSASARPGGPPAKLTGELQRSIQARPVRVKKRSVEAAVGVTDANKAEERRIAIKAAALEYGGTDKKGRVHPAFPFMRTTEALVESEVDATIARVLEAGE